jgi:phosphoglycerate dehydrogenase-like enzyme
MKRVLYLSHATPEVYAIIATAVPEGLELVTLERDDDDERRRKIADCDAVIVAATPLRKPVIDAAGKLALVHHQGVGWQDTTDHELLRARGIPLALTPEGTTVGVAEHTVLLILAVLKLLPHADRELRAGRFHVNALRPVSRELQGLTVGYVGMGRIARAVARRLAGFDVRGLFFDPQVDAHPGIERAPLERVLEQSDVVTLHVPLTPQTRHMIGREQIAHMKRGAYLVNTARGGLIDEAALVEALRSGHLAGAALDVFEQEPMPAAHPLYELRNVVLTPHISAGTRDALATKMSALFANVERFFRGEPLHNRVF